MGIRGEAELFLGIWGAKANTFRETRKLFSGRRGDECIIFRDQGNTDPPHPGGPHSFSDLFSDNLATFNHLNMKLLVFVGILQVLKF